MPPIILFFRSGPRGYAQLMAAILYFVLAIAVLLPLVGLFSQAARHDNAIVEQAYLRDVSGQLTIRDVEGLSFVPYDGPLTKGFDASSVYWLKIRIRADDPTVAPMILRLRPFWHDDIRLFDSANPRPEPRVTGDRHSWSVGDAVTLGHGFLLPRTPFPRDIYLRVQSVHSYHIEAQALAQTQAWWADVMLLMVYVLYIGVLFVAAAWSLASYSRTPDPLVGTFGLYQFAQLIYYFFAVGLAQILLDNVLPPEWLDGLMTCLIIVVALLAMIFHVALLQHHRIARRWTFPLKIIATTPFIALLIYLFGDASRSLAVNSFAIALFSLMAPVVVWFGAPADHADATALPRRWLILFYVLIAMIGLVAAGPLLALLTLEWVSVDLFLLHSAMVTLAMSMFLGNRQRQLAKSYVAAQKEAEFERRAREDQNNFVTMLNHELKTPLSILKLLFARHTQQRLGETTIDNITALVERCVLSDRLDHTTSLRKKDFHPVAVIRGVVANLPHDSRVTIEGDYEHALYNDPEIFSVMVSNLLDNALKYSPPGSPVLVSIQAAVRDNRPVILFSVQNSIGRCGMPDLDCVFEKYYRAEGARCLPGTGLGLYLVRAFSQKMGGRIECEVDANALEQICFTICLPR
jgi:signal transduction histidine kinase